MHDNDPVPLGADPHDEDMDEDDGSQTLGPRQGSRSATTEQKVDASEQESEDKPRDAPSSAGKAVVEQKASVASEDGREHHQVAIDDGWETPELRQAQQSAVFGQEDHLSQQAEEPEPRYSATAAGNNATAQSTTATVHPARHASTRLYGRDWDKHRPLMEEEPKWALGLVERKKLPVAVQAAMKKLERHGPEIWRKMQAKSVEPNVTRLERPQWIVQLADDVEALREVKSELTEHVKALRFVVDKELLAVDCMYAFAECEGGWDGDPLLFMLEPVERISYARLTDQHLTDARKELSQRDGRMGQGLRGAQEHLGPHPKLTDRDFKEVRERLGEKEFTFERRELYMREFDRVKARFEAAMEREFPEAEREEERVTDGQATCEMALR
ncbi:hypothetical protein LTR65_008731 [Meristemomyces frigidus]